jgi:hypothetical protein
LAAVRRAWEGNLLAMPVPGLTGQLP